MISHFSSVNLIIFFSNIFEKNSFKSSSSPERLVYVKSFSTFKCVDLIHLHQFPIFSFYPLYDYYSFIGGDKYFYIEKLNL